MSFRSPNFQHIAILVGELADDNQDEVNDRPEAEAAEGQQLRDTGADFSRVEPVGAEAPQKKAQQERDNTFLFRYLRHDSILLGFQCVRADSAPAVPADKNQV